jgi:uncharacterized membrane protein HdeD (DUF308 family)
LEDFLMSSAANPIPELVNKSISWSIFLSVLLILAGLCALLVPFISGLGITLFIGWAMLLSGVFHLIFAFKTHTTGSVLWELLLGAVYIGSGLYLIFHPLSGLVSLTFLLIIYLVFESILEFIHAYQVRPRTGSGWLIFDGIITLLLAVMIWRSWPFSTVWAIGTLVGISMLFSGISRLMLSLAARKVAHHLA